MVVTCLPQKATKFLHEQVTYQYNTDKPIHERKSLMTREGLHKQLRDYFKQH